MCFNLIQEWQNLKFKIQSVRHILRNFLMAILFTLRVSAKNLRETVAEEIFLLLTSIRNFQLSKDKKNFEYKQNGWYGNLGRIPNQMILTAN